MIWEIIGNIGNMLKTFIIYVLVQWLIKNRFKKYIFYILFFKHYFVFIFKTIKNYLYLIYFSIYQKKKFNIF